METPPCGYDTLFFDTIFVFSSLLMAIISEPLIKKGALFSYTPSCIFMFQTYAWIFHSIYCGNKMASDYINMVSNIPFLLMPFLVIERMFKMFKTYGNRKKSISLFIWFIVSCFNLSGIEKIIKKDIIGITGIIIVIFFAILESRPRKNDETIDVFHFVFFFASVASIFFLFAPQKMDLNWWGKLFVKEIIVMILYGCYIIQTIREEKEPKPE